MDPEFEFDRGFEHEGPGTKATDVFFRVKNRLYKNEKSKTYMYRDIVGVITVGVGFALKSKTDAQRLKWFDRKTKRPVTRAEVDDAYDVMKKQPYGRSFAATFFENKTTIRISENMIYPQFVKRLSEFRTELQNTFGQTGLNSLPPPVQEALFDLAWNTGGDIGTGFPKLTAAIKDHLDWLAVARETHRDTEFVDEDRNVDIRNLVLEALKNDRRL